MSVAGRGRARDAGDVDGDDDRRGAGVGGGWLDDARHREEDVGEDDAHGARGGCADAAGRCLGEVDRGAVVGGDGPGEEAASSGVRGVAGGRAECRAAGGVRGAGRARALARAVHEDDARRGVLLEEHLGEATHGGVGVRTRSARAGSRRGCSLEDGTRGGGRSDARAPGRNLHAAKDARG